MESVKVQCRSHEVLKSRLRADVKVYIDAVQNLERIALGTAKDDHFDKALKRAETAQRVFRRARERLNKHASEHGCE